MLCGTFRPILGGRRNNHTISCATALPHPRAPTQLHLSYKQASTNAAKNFIFATAYFQEIGVSDFARPRRGKDPRKPKRFSWPLQGGSGGNRNPPELLFSFASVFFFGEAKKKMLRKSSPLTAPTKKYPLPEKRERKYETTHLFMK